MAIRLAMAKRYAQHSDMYEVTRGKPERWTFSGILGKRYLGLGDNVAFLLLEDDEKWALVADKAVESNSFWFTPKLHAHLVCDTFIVILLIANSEDGALDLYAPEAFTESTVVEDLFAIQDSRDGLRYFGNLSHPSEAHYDIWLPPMSDERFCKAIDTALLQKRSNIVSLNKRLTAEEVQNFKARDIPTYTF